MENKPFTFGVAASGDNFTDREKETERLMLNFRHGVNTVLISPRRWGKTSLVHKVCRLVQSDQLKVVYLDIFSCRSDKDFYDAFASAILKQTSSKLEEWVENAKLFLARITPKISIGPDPMTDFSISLEINPKSNDIDEILQLHHEERPHGDFGRGEDDVAYYSNHACQRALPGARFTVVFHRGIICQRRKKSNYI